MTHSHVKKDLRRQNLWQDREVALTHRPSCSCLIPRLPPNSSILLPDLLDLVLQVPKFMQKASAQLISFNHQTARFAFFLVLIDLWNFGHVTHERNSSPACFSRHPSWTMFDSWRSSYSKAETWWNPRKAPHGNNMWIGFTYNKRKEKRADAEV